MPQRNDKMGRARRRGDDEFYTPRAMIEAELQHYDPRLFKGKRILCNCDDPLKSHFFRYFADNFGKLKLQRVVGLRYAPSALFDKGLKQSRWQFPSDENTPPYKQTLFADKNGKRRMTGMVDLPPGDTGGFDGDEGLRQLKGCDIIVTNPPFSKFSKFMDLLMQSGKKFIVIGNINAVTQKGFSPLIQSGKIWFGTGRCKGKFERPRGDEASASSCWFTNLSHARRENNYVPLTETYTAKQYPIYDNYPAIEVGKVVKIPADYYGEMGVPISYLEKHNPKQFEIVGLCWLLLKERQEKGNVLKVQGRKKYRRMIIRRTAGDGNWIERKDLDRNTIYGNAGGFVYVAVIPGDAGWYKIGKAENVAKRVKGEAFARKDPKVVMSLEVHNRHQAEKQVHDALAKHREKGKEWFRLPQKELEAELSAIAGKPIRLWQ